MIYDCVLYNDEEIIFDLRYNILKDVVDKFIIIEMDKTFSGKPKPYLFNKVSHNIINIRLKGREIKESSWNCEYRSRNCISTFDFIDDDDYFIMSDLDEIPRPELLPTIGAYELNWYYYYLNGYKGKWVAPICMKWEDWKKHTAQDWRINRYNLPIIQNAGWHFAYMLPILFISNKIKSFAHTELDKNEFTDPNKIYERIKDLKDLYDRNNESKITRVDIDDTYPKYILDNLDTYQEYIL